MDSGRHYKKYWEMSKGEEVWCGWSVCKWSCNGSVAENSGRDEVGSLHRPLFHQIMACLTAIDTVKLSDNAFWFIWMTMAKKLWILCFCSLKLIPLFFHLRKLPKHTSEVSVILKKQLARFFYIHAGKRKVLLPSKHRKMITLILLSVK